MKFLIFFLIIFANYSFAQSPGGVSSGAQLWLRADSGTNCATNTCTITSWGGNLSLGNNASQPNVAEQPEFFAATPELNFNPSIKYSGDQILAIENLNYTSADRTQLYTWIVFRTADNDGTSFNNWAFLDFDRSEFFNIYSQPDSGTLGWSYHASGIIDNDGTSAINDGRVHIANGGYDMTITNDTTIRIDGDLEVSSDRRATNINLGDNITRFGFSGDGSEATAFNGNSNGFRYDGEIAEIILYSNQQLSLTNKQQIESYLAIKYGITLKTTDGGVNGDYLNSVGTTIWDATSDSGDFNNEVFAIARDDNGGLHQKQSKSVSTANSLTAYHGSGYLGNFPSANTANTNNLSNNQYLFFGHNVDDLSIASSVSPSPFGVNYCEQSMARIYKVIDSGSTGVVTLVFDPTLFTTLVPGTKYSIAVSNNLAFSSFATSAPLVEASSGMFYAEIDFPNSQASYFRIVQGDGVRNDTSITPICYSYIIG